MIDGISPIGNRDLFERLPHPATDVADGDVDLAECSLGFLDEVFDLIRIGDVAHHADCTTAFAVDFTHHGIYIVPI